MSLHEALTALLGDLAGGHFYLQVLPQEYELPCIVFRTLSKEPVATLCETAQHQYVVSFDCWAETYAQAFTIAEELKTALDADTSLVKYEDDSPGEDFDSMQEDFLEPVYFGFLH